MPAIETPPAQIGWHAPDFNLKGTDGQTYSLADVKGENGLVVMFICNHCPFVKAILERIIRDMRELQHYGIGSIAIMSNDTQAYPDDSFDKMADLADLRNFPFPYVLDATQEIAKMYDAVCTPDFFGFDGDLKLQYRGRLDASRMEAIPDAPRDLFDAMVQVARTGKAPHEQWNSIGCSIKWRDG
jgi:peroxiredoxin